MAGEVVEAGSPWWGCTADAKMSLQPSLERVAWASAATSYEDVDAADPGASHAALAAVAAAAAVVGEDAVDGLLLGAERRPTYVCT